MRVVRLELAAFLLLVATFAVFNVERRHSQHSLVENVGSPQQKYRNAYGTLCVGDAIVVGTLVLFHSLRKVHSNADFVAMTHNVSRGSLALLHDFGIRTYDVPILEVDTYMSTRVESMEARDSILWTKLRIWQLEDYDRVVMMDADLMVLRNVDELFQYPELAACAMADVREKIQFYQTAEYGLSPHNRVDRRRGAELTLMRGWSGLNSGVSVVTPSSVTFSKLLTELSILPHRPCCPSQEFLFHYFEERGRFFRLSSVYNSRSYLDDNSNNVIMRHLKIHHFVGAKPWKKRDGTPMNKLWWRLRDELSL